MAIAVTNNNGGMEAGALTSGGLLLHAADLDHFLLKGHELVDDLALFDGKGVLVDLVQGGDNA